jgi:hypothetical protein
VSRFLGVENDHAWRAFGLPYFSRTLNLFRNIVCYGKIGIRLIKFALALVSAPAPPVGIDRIRFQPDRLTVIADRRVEVIFAVVARTTIRVRLKGLGMRDPTSREKGSILNQILRPIQCFQQMLGGRTIENHAHRRCIKSF